MALVSRCWRWCAGRSCVAPPRRHRPQRCRRAAGAAAPAGGRASWSSALAWAGPITHTGGHARSVAKETIAAITGKGVDGPGSSDASYWIFSGDQTTPRERMDLFVQETIAYRDAKIAPEDQVMPDPGERVLSPRAARAEPGGAHPVGRALDAVGLDPVHVNSAVRFGCAVLMQVFALVGMVWLLLRRRRHPAWPCRGPSREVAFLTWGAMGGLALVVLVPNLSVDYGVLRAFQQTLLVIAPVMAMGMWVRCARSRWRPRCRRARRRRTGGAAARPGRRPARAARWPAAADGAGQRRHLLRPVLRLRLRDAGDGLARSVDHADRTNERDHRQPQRQRAAAGAQRQPRPGGGPALPDAAVEGRLRVRRRADPRPGRLDGLLHR